MSRPSEDELIATYFAPLAGPGAFGLCDDAAILAQKPGHDIVATKDMLIAGVHFFTDDPPGAVARKALRVNLS
ncbi:MAG TPA: AIR synthase related protein, partial [Methylocella sp.]|nr:AIR synthase related protein [Methylocella sp.]